MSAPCLQFETGAVEGLLRRLGEYKAEGWNAMINEGLCREKAKKIRFLVLDVDGVLTDGQIIVDGRGRELKAFDVKDGHRLVMARRHGIKVVFISGRESDVVSHRAAELSVHRVYQGALDKKAAMKRFLKEEGAAIEEVAYLGDDLVDLPAMRRAGLAGAVRDAVPEVRAAADWISRFPGGRGAVRELVEFILEAQGLWEEATERYRS